MTPLVYKSRAPPGVVARVNALAKTFAGFSGLAIRRAGATNRRPRHSVVDSNADAGSLLTVPPPGPSKDLLALAPNPCEGAHIKATSAPFRVAVKEHCHKHGLSEPS
jgi:hypothetical protein